MTTSASTIKLLFNSQKYMVPLSIPPQMLDLYAFVYSLSPSMGEDELEALVFMYSDDEGDVITLHSDAALVLALEELKPKQTLEVVVHPTPGKLQQHGMFQRVQRRSTQAAILAANGNTTTQPIMASGAYAGETPACIYLPCQPATCNALATATATTAECTTTSTTTTTSGTSDVNNSIATLAAVALPVRTVPLQAGDLVWARGMVGVIVDDPSIVPPGSFGIGHPHTTLPQLTPSYCSAEHGIVCERSEIHLLAPKENRTPPPPKFAPSDWVAWDHESNVQFRGRIYKKQVPPFYDWENEVWNYLVLRAFEQYIGQQIVMEKDLRPAALVFHSDLEWDLPDTDRRLDQYTVGTHIRLCAELELAVVKRIVWVERLRSRMFQIEFASGRLSWISEADYTKCEEVAIPAPLFPVPSLVLCCDETQVVQKYKFQPFSRIWTSQRYPAFVTARRYSAEQKIWVYSVTYNDDTLAHNVPEQALATMEVCQECLSSTNFLEQNESGQYLVTRVCKTKQCRVAPVGPVATHGRTYLNTPTSLEHLSVYQARVPLVEGHKFNTRVRMILHHTWKALLALICKPYMEWIDVRLYLAKIYLSGDIQKLTAEAKAIVAEFGVYEKLAQDGFIDYYRHLYETKPVEAYAHLLRLGYSPDLLPQRGCRYSPVEYEVHSGGTLCIKDVHSLIQGVWHATAC